MSDVSFPFLIEPMTLDDVKEVMAIERLSFPLPWSLSAYQHELCNNRHSHYTVIRQNLPSIESRPLWKRLIRLGRPQPAPVLGYGGFWLVVDEAHISTIAVTPAWRGLGLGEMLLLAMIKQGLELGAHIITLEVRVSNIVAQNLYRKYGFITVGERKHYYRDNGEDAYIMTVEDASSPEYAQRLQTLWSALWARLCSQGKPVEQIGQKTRL